MTELVEARRCPACGTPVGAVDRVCFSCQRVLPLVRPVGGGQPVVDEQAAPVPAGELELEIYLSRQRHNVIIGGTATTLGSSPSADVVVPAPFLAAEHVRFERHGDSWVVEVVAQPAELLVRGAAVRRAEIVPGDIVRLADRAGNFVTVRTKRRTGAPVKMGNLCGVLPVVDTAVIIGGDASSDIRLDHPLVRRRHAIIRRDRSGTLWLEDRATVAGTYLNSERLRGRQRLAVGDVVQIGPFCARVGVEQLEPLEQVSGVDIQVHGATVRALNGKERSGRILLNDVSLHLEPATLTAVAGPSGAGKTTLMRLLSGQSLASNGSVLYNDVDLTHYRQAYASLMGFVPQEDVVHADLTVDEALGFQARLRLSADTGEIERRRAVARAAEFVGLEGQRAQLVRTLSGGQRKRVSIASELLNEPELLFLDEPTSGLDPGLDKRMILLLRLLADQGRTVVLTTHAIAHVEVCDTLILVGPGGYVIYAGPPADAPAWFEVQGLSDVFALIETPAESASAASRIQMGVALLQGAITRPAG